LDSITQFLSNPLVSLVGYILSLIASLIAIKEYKGKKSAKEQLQQLNIKNSILTNETKIKQGDQSQYFEDNKGSVNIDNRS
jgi:hypothetical protein